MEIRPGPICPCAKCTRPTINWSAYKRPCSFCKIPSCRPINSLSVAVVQAAVWRSTKKRTRLSSAPCCGDNVKKFVPPSRKHRPSCDANKNNKRKNSNNNNPQQSPNDLQPKRRSPTERNWRRNCNPCSFCDHDIHMRETLEELE